MQIAIRIIAILLCTVCIYGILGGVFVYREDLPSGLYNSYTLTAYTALPPPPRGPAYCDFLTVKPVGLALPCDFKPPFIGWVQGGRY
jgi:hypothetical protein